MSSITNQTCIDNAAFTLPGRSTACGVTVAKNNTAILAECCGGNPVMIYGPARAPLCNQHCNMSTTTYEESPVFKCLNSSRILTGWACQNEKKESAASSIKNIDKSILAGLVAMIGFGAIGSS